MDEVSAFAFALSQHGFRQDHLEMVIRRKNREPGRIAVHRIRDGYRITILDGKLRASTQVESLSLDSVATILPDWLKREIRAPSASSRGRSPTGPDHTLT